MSGLEADIAIVGAGMAGASLAAAIGGRARVVLIERESQPGYHATGRSAAFWTETYGGAGVQPLTTASFQALEAGGFLGARRALHIADAAGMPALDALAAAFDESAVVLEPLDRAGLAAILTGLSPAYTRGLLEPSCRDIDVAALHAHYLAEARRLGVVLLTDAEALEIARADGRWRIATPGGGVIATMIVNAAGAWASLVAHKAGAQAIPVTPMRRTIVQITTDPPAAADLPLVLDAAGSFYFKPEPGGRLWLSPHDETVVAAHDVAPEELDVAIAIDRLEHVVDWRVRTRERAWAGLRSFAPDRLPIYGFDARVPGFFWFAGQGGFGIQTAPAAAAIGAALLLGRSPPDAVRGIDLARYSPGRFGGL